LKQKNKRDGQSAVSFCTAQRLFTGTQNMRQRFQNYLTDHAIEILTSMAMLAIWAGISYLIQNPPQPNAGETVSWWGIATNISRGFGYSLCNQYYFPFCALSNAATAMREPAPVLLFAGVARLFHESLFVAGVTELLLYIGVMFAVFHLTRDWAGPLAGLLAAFGWAVYPRAISLIPQVSGDLLAALSVTVGILFIQRTRKSDRTRDWLFAGLGLGLAILSRSAMLVVALTVIAGLGIERWHLRQRLLDWLRPSLLVTAMVASLLTPWLVRTEIVFGQPLVGSSLVGYNIYRQNYMLASNDYFRNVGTNEGWAAIQALLARRTDLTGHENEAQMDAVYRQEGLKIIAANPIHYVWLSGYRFFMLWFDWRVSEAFGYPMGFNEYAMMVVQLVLMILAFLGLRGNWKEMWPLWASLLMLTLAYMAVNSRLHYIVPLMPLVISLAAGKTVDFFSAKPHS
jgi:4-amino-4-deoxy-L-arabinose transferase-like glycosyltransferase